MRWCTLGLFKSIPIYLTWVVQATLLGFSNRRFDLLGCASAWKIYVEKSDKFQALRQAQVIEICILQFD